MPESTPRCVLCSGVCSGVVWGGVQRPCQYPMAYLTTPNAGGREGWRIVIVVSVWLSEQIDKLLKHTYFHKFVGNDWFVSTLL